MRTKITRNALWISAGLAVALCVQAQAQTITNGGFESGLAGWTRVDQLGSDGTFFVQSGTSSPVNGFTVPAPPQGVRAAMSDAAGPGSHVLYQDFLVPTGNAATTLNFALYINNGASSFVSPAMLDFAATNTTGSLNLNQQVRVDILSASADPFSVAAGDVLQNLFQTNPGDPLVSGYTNYSSDVSALFQANQGKTLRLRFAEVDNLLFLNLGVDRVGIAVAVPEPSSLLLAGSLMVSGGLLLRRRRRI